MAFETNELARLGSHNTSAGALWLHRTADTAADVNTTGYFNERSKEMKVGDWVLSMSSTGGTPVATVTYVSSNTGGVVDIVNGTAISATDSD